MDLPPAYIYAHLRALGIQYMSSLAGIALIVNNSTPASRPVDLGSKISLSLSINQDGEGVAIPSRSWAGQHSTE